MKNKKLNINNINRKSFVAIASLKPKVKYPLNKVGLVNRPHYINVLDPFNKKNPIKLLASLNILISLSSSNRGVSISRIEKCLHEIANEKELTLENYTKKLCKLVKKNQIKNTLQSRVAIEADYEKCTFKNISGKPSHELFKIYSEYEINKTQEKLGIGLMAQILNACPCAQILGARDFYKYLETKNFTKDEIIALIKEAPLQTHTNRGKVKLFIESDKISFEDIYKVIEKSSPIIRELLNSQDEHLLIKEAHARGMFCEDVAREMAANAYLLCEKKKVRPESRISIEVEVDESIHFHNIYCEIETTFKELKKNIGTNIEQKVF